MGHYDHCRTQAEINSVYKERCAEINQNYRDNIRKIDEESAKVQRECDDAIRRTIPWFYLWAVVAVCWGLVLASGGLFNR